MLTSCACGKVQCEATGAPIATIACGCNDCQAGSRQIEALPNAPAICDAYGATEYVLYRKDRLKCVKGRDLLQDLRLREKSPTKRVIASCCNSALYLDFEKGHWLSVYRSRFTEAMPPLQMRVQTETKRTNANAPTDVPAYSGFPLSLLAKILFAKVKMVLPP